MPRADVDALSGYLRALPSMTPMRPRALLVVTAHWEAKVATVSTSAAPPMLYNYYGFPPESYTITWPAPGSPAAAAQVKAQLAGACIPVAEDATRGFDHGTFVPMKVAYPAVDVRCVQLSLVTGFDPEQHLAIGRALAPLREDGIFVLGSGMSFHNMRAFGDPRAWDVSMQFDDWLRESVAMPRAQRDERLRGWSKAPAGRACHPREEHLLPLMVIAGAAGDDPGRVDWSGRMLGTRISSVRFG